MVVVVVVVVVVATALEEWLRTTPAAPPAMTRADADTMLSIRIASVRPLI
jgi:hypothetical protein